MEEKKEENEKSVMKMNEENLREHLMELRERESITFRWERGREEGTIRQRRGRWRKLWFPLLPPVIELYRCTLCTVHCNVLYCTSSQCILYSVYCTVYNVL